MDIQLLLVDDEELTKECLTNYIDWQSLGITAVRSAGNGLEALKITEEFIPDILLTDVKMPHMNGIDLAMKIREKFPSCKILFLSGYADKEYLKSAIDLKAESYIEKPVILNNVSLAVSKTIQIIRLEKQDQETRRKQTNVLSKTHQLIHAEIISELLSPTFSQPDFLQKYSPDYFTWQDNVSYLASCIQLHEMPEQDIKYSARVSSTASPMASMVPAESLVDTGSTTADSALPLSMHQLCQYLYHYLIDHQRFTANDFYLGYREKNTLVLLTHVTYSAFLHDILTEIAQIISEKTHSTTTIAIGPVVHRIDEIRRSFLIALENLEFHYMYYNYRGILDCHFALEKKPVPQNLFTGKRVSAAALYDLIQVLAKEQYTNINYLREKLYQLYISYTTEAPVSWELFRQYTMPDYMQLVTYGISSLDELNAHKQYHPQIQKAIRYMLLNYADASLNISSIAQEVDLSQNYLCSLFKQNTNTTVGEYLLHIRMERTCHYLKHSDLKLYEIADKVGIPDANYLNTLFKMQYGMTPTRYRKEG